MHGDLPRLAKVKSHKPKTARNKGRIVKQKYYSAPRMRKSVRVPEGRTETGGPVAY